MVFIDSNIPMYVAGRDHPLRAPAMRLLERVRAGEIEACSGTEVLQEILYRYAGLRRPTWRATSTICSSRCAPSCSR